MSVPRIQQSFCSTKISTVIKDAVQSLGCKEIRKDQFQNFLNTWCDHEIADSAQPRNRSTVTRPFSLIVRAGSGHETNLIATSLVPRPRPHKEGKKGLVTIYWLC